MYILLQISVGIGMIIDWNRNDYRPLTNYVLWCGYDFTIRGYVNMLSDITSATLLLISLCMYNISPKIKEKRYLENNYDIKKIIKICKTIYKELNYKLKNSANLVEFFNKHIFYFLNFKPDPHASPTLLETS